MTGGAVLTVLVAAFIAGLLPIKPNFTPYPKGLYRSANGTEYELTQGPAALSVTGPDNLCLMFWDRENPPRGRKVIELKGQQCGVVYSNLDWTARYSVDRLNEVRLTAQGEPPHDLTRVEPR